MTTALIDLSTLEKLFESSCTRRKRRLGILPISHGRNARIARQAAPRRRPSGYEAPRGSLPRRRLLRGDLRDGLGSTIARIGDGRPARHRGPLDEIGLVVTHVDDKGFLWFAPVGGWDPQILVGQRVEVHTKDGPVTGVVGRKPVHLLEADQQIRRWS